MPASVANSAVTLQDNSDVFPHPKPAKAAIAPLTTLDNLSLDVLSGLVMDATKAVYGKQAAAAAQLGKDEGNFSRDVKAGRFTLQQLALLGPEVAAAVGRALVEEFGPLTTPLAIMRAEIRRCRRSFDLLEQGIDHLEQK